MSAAHAESDHFVYDITSKVKTKFLGNSLDIYPVGRQEFSPVSLSRCHTCLKENDILTGFIDRIIMLGLLMSFTFRDCTTHQFGMYNSLMHLV